ncbi:MAG TPA: methyltransferase domain-containing protein, partial [Allocoleopsis sp.]
MPKQLSEATISECQAHFNLTYHVPFAYQCQRMVGFAGKDVLEVGGSLPKEFVLDYLQVKSWSAVESPDYEEFLQDVEGTPHDGSVIHQLGDMSRLGFRDRDLTNYNLFFAYVEDLPPEHYGKYDLIFSLSAFEHIQRFPKALEKMYLALKPSGQLFSMFSPIWSAHDGHHLPNVVDQQGREFNFYKSNPIPPWGHLLMRPAELCRYLYQITDKETADLIVYYVYNSPQINRFFTEDYIEFFRQSNFLIKNADLTFNTIPPPDIQNTLERLYPGRTSFGNNGLLIVLEKGDQVSQSVTTSDRKLMTVSASPQSEHSQTATSIPENQSHSYPFDNTMETELYTRNFYDSLHEGSRQSARAIVPIVMELIQPKSVLDVGCGTGNWLAVFHEYGIEDYLGIDGDYVDLDDLQISKQRFIPHDLKEPLPLDRTFDLVMTVEVAEHLPADLAEPFVKSLTRLSPVILFSAAIPQQGGTGHINEQWLEYWVERFQQQGYTAIDCLRDKI